MRWTWKQSRRQAVGPGWGRGWGGVGGAGPAAEKELPPWRGGGGHSTHSPNFPLTVLIIFHGLLPQEVSTFCLHSCPVCPIRTRLVTFRSLQTVTPPSPPRPGSHLPWFQTQRPAAQGTPPPGQHGSQLKLSSCPWWPSACSRCLLVPAPWGVLTGRHLSLPSSPPCLHFIHQLVLPHSTA